MAPKKVVIGSDHGGFALKKLVVPFLKESGYEVLDVGPDTPRSCDYPMYADKVVEKVLAENTLGILICGTGLGMSMAANRHKKIRAAVCTNEYMAAMAKKHNDANILCLGDRVIGFGLAKSLITTFLETDFEGERHLRRIGLFSDMD